MTSSSDRPARRAKLQSRPSPGALEAASSSLAAPAPSSAPPTEERNPRTESIDLLSTEEALHLLHRESAVVQRALEHAIPELARAVDEAAARLAAGGSMHYFGAGTSGRIAVMDAAELVPTFGVPENLVVAHLAGGDPALRWAVEGAEDDEAAGAAQAAELTAREVAVGLTASGGAPFVAAALRRARAEGACTVLLSSHPHAPAAAYADHHVLLPTGPEPITGSTRMNAATAQKVALNALSTLVMVRLGRTYSNFMVDVVPTNAKLRRRVVAMLAEASGRSEAHCRQVLGECAGDVKIALLALSAEVPAEEAALALSTAGTVRGALAALINRDHAAR